MGAVKIPIGQIGGAVSDIQQIFDAVYPVGCIYQSFVNTNPSELFGGQWQQITGRFLRAANDTNIGGSDTVTLTVNQIPSHTHMENQQAVIWMHPSGDRNLPTGNSVAAGDARGAYYTGAAGGGQAHNNMPSYQDVYTWRRIA